jgi:hypothetical protein
MLMQHVPLTTSHMMVSSGRDRSTGWYGAHRGGGVRGRGVRGEGVWGRGVGCMVQGSGFGEFEV